MKPIFLCATALTSFALLAANAPPGEVPAPQDARAEYRQLVKEHGAAMKEFDAEVARLEENDKAEAEEYAESWNPTQAFVDRFAEAAESYAGTEEAVQFLEWIVMFDHTAGEELGESTIAALDALIDEHAEDASFLSNVQYIGFRTNVYGGRVQAVRLPRQGRGARLLGVIGEAPAGPCTRTSGRS